MPAHWKCHLCGKWIDLALPIEDHKCQEDPIACIPKGYVVTFDPKRCFFMHTPIVKWLLGEKEKEALWRKMSLAGDGYVRGELYASL